MAEKLRVQHFANFVRLCVHGVSDAGDRPQQTGGFQRR